MGLSKRDLFIAGLLSGVCVLGACASAYPIYKYYGIAPENFNGSLLGETEKDDLPFKKCEPDPPDPEHPIAQVKGKCVVLFESEFFAMTKELFDLRLKLKSCPSRAPD